MSKSVLVIGATSAIAEAVCHILASRGDRLILAARNAEQLESIRCDLNTRFQTAPVAIRFDALDFEGHTQFISECFESARGKIDLVILCHGMMTDQNATQTDVEAARTIVDVNFTSAVTILHLVAERFESSRAGQIAVITSVAGDRGRQSNYSYGAAKAGVSAFVQGLRNRLHHADVPVLTAKLGFVDTPMTDGLLNPHSPLVASPARVARDIVKAIDRKRNIIYSPWFWRPIMMIIRWIPEPIFKQLRL